MVNVSIGKVAILSPLLLFVKETFGSFTVRPNQYRSINTCIRGKIYNNNNHVMKKRVSSYRITSVERTKELWAGGIGDFFNFFDYNENKGQNKENKNTFGNEANEYDQDENEDYLGCSNIFTIEAKSLKVGGCRLYLSLFFMGETNNPERGTWRMNQNEDGGIDLYFKDTTGALIIEFEEDAIQVKRLGSSPSMEYLVQESSMLSGMLDQLDEIAMDTNISESDRLLCIEDDEINKVRESLSFT